MLEFSLNEMHFTAFIFLLSIIIVLPIQLLLCFKVKSRIVRLLPVLLLILTIIASWLSVIVFGDWLFLFVFIFLLAYAPFILLACGAGWGIWFIVYQIKKKRNSAGMSSNL